MARANSKKVDSQPTREHEIFGFDPLGADVSIPLGSLIDLVSYNHAGMSYKGKWRDESSLRDHRWSKLKGIIII